MMQINNKFEIGQEVYLIQKRGCEICDGKGSFYIPCPRCKDTNKGQFVVVDGTHKITGIRTNTHDGVNFSIRYNVSGNKRPENRVFATFEDAVTACELLNKKEEV